MSLTADRQAAMYAAPFAPELVSGNGPDVDAALQTAIATEYAAAQLGMLARAVEKIEQHFAKTAGHFPTPGSAEEAMRFKSSRLAEKFSP